MTTELIEKTAQQRVGLQAQVETATTRAMQEVQVAMTVAKRFPRDEEQQGKKIVAACNLPNLAKIAMYSYPKGGGRVSGPSIRFAEEMARHWTNLDFGIVELERRIGESTVMAYCWDLETNVRQTKIFSVKHRIDYKDGRPPKELTDDREIYEKCANYGARRLRACILGIIPAHIQDAAVEQCEKTLATGHTVPLSERIGKMVEMFYALGVPQAAVEKRLGHYLGATTEKELVGLGTVYKSIADGMGSADDFFEIPAVSVSPPVEGVDTSKSKSERLGEKVAADLKPADDYGAQSQPKPKRKRRTKAEMEAARAAEEAQQQADNQVVSPETALVPSDRYVELSQSVRKGETKAELMGVLQECLASKDYLTADESENINQKIREKLDGCA